MLVLIGDTRKNAYLRKLCVCWKICLQSKTHSDINRLCVHLIYTNYKVLYLTKEFKFIKVEMFEEKFSFWLWVYSRVKLELLGARIYVTLKSKAINSRGYNFVLYRYYRTTNIVPFLPFLLYLTFHLINDHIIWTIFRSKGSQ